MDFNILIDKLKKAYNWVANLDWKNPRVILSAVALCIFPLIAKYLVLTGLVIGICLAISVLLLVEKSPRGFKRWVHKNPLVADLVLSTFAVVSIGSFLGTGMTLALGFIFLDLTLAMTLPYATQEAMLEPV